MSIKQYFVSRYPQGYLVEADYSQLEIRALAELSGDHQLKGDLDSGQDLHSINAANWLKKPIGDVRPEERRAAKTISFQLQYGASYKGIAKRSGISEGEAKAFIDAYETRYRGVVAWQQRVMGEVEATRSHIEKRTPSGYIVEVGQYRCPITRRVYKFETRDDKYRGGTSFYAPEIKNYPVQGFATGDIVPTALGRLMRHMLKDNREGVLINTVHDSILIDCPKEELEYTCTMARRLLEQAPVYIEEDYGTRMNNALPVDVKYGRNWEDMTGFV